MRHVSGDWNLHQQRCEYLKYVFNRILYPLYLLERNFDMLLPCQNTSGIISQLTKFRYVIFLW